MRRDPGALDALADKLQVVIARTPGKRMEDISRDLGIPTRKLQLPIRKLIAARRISTKGVKRSTIYFAS